MSCAAAPCRPIIPSRQPTVRPALPGHQEIAMSRRRSFRQALKRAVAERRLLVVPGAYDDLSALLIEGTGFDRMFVGGFPVAGARYGVPDIGLEGFADIAAAVRVFFSSRRRHTRFDCDWSSDVCSSD